MGWSCTEGKFPGSDVELVVLGSHSLCLALKFRFVMSSSENKLDEGIAV